MDGNGREHLKCSSEVVDGLIELVLVAVIEKFPKISADADSIEAVIDGIRLLRPQVPELGVLQGLLDMGSSRWDNAIDVLRDVCADAPRFVPAKVLVAFCLSMKGNADWQRWADEATALNPGPVARRLLSLLYARDDLIDAIRRSYCGETFVVPASVSALSEDRSDYEKLANSPVVPAVKCGISSTSTHT
jgi:type III secretion protein HrpB1